MLEKLSKKGELLTVVIVVVVVVAIALATAVAVMVAGASEAGRVGLEQSEAINAKLRYDRTKEMVDDAVWLGIREAYFEARPKYDKGFTLSCEGIGTYQCFDNTPCQSFEECVKEENCDSTCPSPPDNSKLVGDDSGCGAIYHCACKPDQIGGASECQGGSGDCSATGRCEYSCDAGYLWDDENKECVEIGITDKIKDYMNTLNGTEMTQDERTPDYYVDLNLVNLDVDSYPEPVVVDFPVDVNAWGYTGWGDCGSMTGSWEDVNQFCRCMGYEGAAQKSGDPCYQEWEYNRRRWEPDDNDDNCIDYWGDTGSGYAMTKVKCNVRVYNVSYEVGLSGSMQNPRISLSDEYSSYQVIGPVILTVESTTGGKVDLPERYGNYKFEGEFLFERGDEVSLKAYPDDGWYFDYWSGDVPEGEEKYHTIKILMDRDKSVKAHFDWYRELTVDSTSGGHVDVNPEREDGYKAGAKVTLTAKPSTGYEFVKWTGDVPEGNEEEREITIIMDNNRDLKAHFEQYCDPDQCPVDGDCKDPGDTWGSHNQYCCTDEVDVSECSGILVCSSDGDGDCPDKSCVRWENWSRCGWGPGITR